MEAKELPVAVGVKVKQENVLLEHITTNNVEQNESKNDLHMQFIPNAKLEVPENFDSSQIDNNNEVKVAEMYIESSGLGKLQKLEPNISNHKSEPFPRVKLEPEVSKDVNLLKLEKDLASEVNIDVENMDVIKIKDEVDLKTELLTEECNLLPVKSEEDIFDVVNQPCNSKQSQICLRLSKGIARKGVKKKKLSPCAVYRKYCSSSSSRNNHNLSKYKNSCIQCSFCVKVCLTPSEFWFHFNSYHVVNAFFKDFNSRKSSRSKQVIPQSPEPDKQKSKCEMNSKPFSEKSYLITHMPIYSDEEPFKCEICSKQFSQTTSLTNHMQIHSGQKPFKCEIGSAQFSSKSSLISHMRIHSGEEPFKCEICSKLFSLNSNLINHMRIHSGEKPFKCETCSRQFSQKSNLITHMRIHSGEKPFKCEICSKQFSKKSGLTTHIRIHSGKKPFKCEICLKQFSRKVNLLTHIRIHSGEKPFTCEVCLKQFSRKGNLLTHMRIHSGEKPFKCEFCFNEFSHKSSLTTHINSFCKKNHLNVEESMGKTIWNRVHIQ